MLLLEVENWLKWDHKFGYLLNNEIRDEWLARYFLIEYIGHTLRLEVSLLN